MNEFDMVISRRIGKRGSRRSTGTGQIIGTRYEVVTTVGGGKTAAADQRYKRPGIIGVGKSTRVDLGREEGLRHGMPAVGMSVMMEGRKITKAHRKEEGSTGAKEELY